MYGDTSRLRTQASTTRENANQLRSLGQWAADPGRRNVLGVERGDTLRARIRTVDQTRRRAFSALLAGVQRSP